MDKATGLYRFNMIRNSELAGVYVGRQASPGPALPPSLPPSPSLPLPPSLHSWAVTIWCDNRHTKQLICLEAVL
jgi:hypothetical protein